VKRFWIFVATATAVTVVLGALGAGPTTRWAGPASLGALLAGCAVGLLASVLGVLPSVLLRRPPQEAALVALGAMGLRFGAAALLGLVLVLATPLPPRPLLLWIGISYLILLPLETRFVLRQSAENSSEKTAETAERVKTI
jgi:hypothetical protein